jgi:G3E family GTPase
MGGPFKFSLDKCCIILLVVRILHLYGKEVDIMTKVDIISGFLGAGKTTLIKKLLLEGLKGENVVLIENEFGEIGVDGGFLKDAGIEIREMNSGCICCSLVGDFGTALKDVIDKYHPDRIIIEPSGVGKLSDVIKAVKDLHIENEIRLNSASTVVDATKAKVYMKNFGEFFNNQIEHAGTVVLSRTQNMSAERLDMVIEMMRKLNGSAHIITTPWDELEGAQILAAMENVTNLELEMLAEAADKTHEHDEHEHHHHHHGEECGCGHHHDDDDEHEHHHHHDHDDEDEHEHHHHHDDEDEHEHHHHHDDEDEHEHHHHHDDEDEHEHHHHHDGDEHEHHHHHHADEVFSSWGVETPKKFDRNELESILKKLADSEEYGQILRSKGMLENSVGGWMYFDLVPGEYEIRDGKPDFTGRICVIGSKLNEAGLKELFGL